MEKDPGLGGWGPCSSKGSAAIRTVRSRVSGQQRAATFSVQSGPEPTQPQRVAMHRSHGTEKGPGSTSCDASEQERVSQVGFKPSQAWAGVTSPVWSAWTPTFLKAPQCTVAQMASLCGSRAGAQFLSSNTGHSAVAWAEH